MVQDEPNGGLPLVGGLLGVRWAANHDAPRVGVGVGVELEMKAAGFVNFGTDLINPDFAAVAQGMGIFARRVERSEDLADAVAEVLAHDGPALLDVVTERQELSMPPTITAEQVKGFALYAIRTVLSGRGDELLDLAKANWRQLF